jgi:hypothetical protein
MTATAAPRATGVHLAERLTCFNPDEPRVGNRWPAVWSIGAGSFSLVFAEVIPVGLLAHLSHTLHVSIGAGGLTIVIPAVTPRRRSQSTAGFRRGCGAGEVSGDRVRTNFIQTMTR